MEQQLIEKLENFLEVIKQIGNLSVFHVGGIWYKNDYKETVLKQLKKSKIKLIPSAGVHEDVILKDLLEPIFKGETVALEYADDLSGKILNQLNNLKSNQIDVTLANLAKPIVFKPKERGGKLILLVNKEKFDQLPLGDLITDVCNL